VQEGISGHTLPIIPADFGTSLHGLGLPVGGGVCDVSAQTTRPRFSSVPLPCSPSRTRIVMWARETSSWTASRMRMDFTPLTGKLCGNEEVWRCLAAFVERHATSFGLA